MGGACCKKSETTDNILNTAKNEDFETTKYGLTVENPEVLIEEDKKEKEEDVWDAPDIEKNYM